MHWMKGFSRASGNHIGHVFCPCVLPSICFILILCSTRVVQRQSVGRSTCRECLLLDVMWPVCGLRFLVLLLITEKSKVIIFCNASDQLLSVWASVRHLRLYQGTKSTTKNQCWFLQDKQVSPKESQLQLWNEDIYRQEEKKNVLNLLN